VTDGDGVRPLDPVHVLDLLVPERDLLCELLTGLEPADWKRPTECPAWTVQGVALHVLGDDLSLLARQRDSEVPSLLTEMSLPTWDGAPDAVLDRFNERWVHAATFLSPTVLVDLLRLTGTWTHDWYTTVDPDAGGEPVMLFGLASAPYRAIAAREYLERWVHQLQIRRALGVGDGPLGEAPHLDRAVEIVARAMASLVALVVPTPDRTVTIEFGAQPYTYRHTDLGETPHGWTPHRGRGATASVTVSVAPSAVATLVSRGLTRPDAVAALVVRDGDPELADALVAGMAAAMSAYYVEL
jgi:uncharacterized protein (TIGR03083 family)